MEILFSQQYVGEMRRAMRHWHINFPRGFIGFEVANLTPSPMPSPSYMHGLDQSLMSRDRGFGDVTNIGCQVAQTAGNATIGVAGIHRTPFHLSATFSTGLEAS